MEMVDNGKEPGNWELYRGIERVEAAVHEISKNSVSAAVFAVEKQALTSAIEEARREVIGLRAEQLADRGTLNSYIKEQDAQRGRNRLFVYGLLASPFVGALAGYVVNSLAT